MDEVILAAKRYSTVAEFYPFYLDQHRSATNRRLHVVGTGLLLALATWTVVTREWRYGIALPIVGYGFAWCGHFFIEKNKPATFQYPWLSFVCDFRMFFDVLRGKVKLW